MWPVPGFSPPARVVPKQGSPAARTVVTSCRSEQMRLSAHHDGAVADVQDVDGGVREPSGRAGDGQDLPEEAFAAARVGEAAGVKRRRRMLPSEAISVIMTLTQANVPVSACQRASYLAAA